VVETPEGEFKEEGQEEEPTESLLGRLELIFGSDEFSETNDVLDTKEVFGESSEIPLRLIVKAEEDFLFKTGLGVEDTLLLSDLDASPVALSRLLLSQLLLL
jgi:hypothetical protein